MTKTAAEATRVTATHETIYSLFVGVMIPCKSRSRRPRVPSARLDVQGLLLDCWRPGFTSRAQLSDCWARLTQPEVPDGY